MMHLKWILTYITIIMIVGHGFGEDLHVTVIPIHSDYNETENAEVILHYENRGPDTVFIYDWYLPKTELLDPLFKITRDGNNIAYVGPLIKRAAPTAEDMIAIKSGMNVTTRVQLSSVYNMTETGSYVIQFKVYTDPMLLTSFRKRRADNPSLITSDRVILQSTPTELFVVGRRNALIEKGNEVNMQGRASSYTYFACKQPQKDTIVSAIRSAVTYASNTNQYLSKMRSASTTRYSTWFGTFSVNNLNTLKSYFANINRVLTSEHLHFNCLCLQGKTYAWVNPNIHYTIHLCGLFWPAPLTGTDSKAGTLIHEISHFSDVASTDDHSYGQNACKALAKANAAQALNNADNLQYFAENNPVLQ